MIELIKKLINSQREGAYWDFKQEPHSNNSDLLHDILCFSNSLHRGEKYIIFGVSEVAGEYKISGRTGVRKRQSDYIDFLRSLDFASDNRPEIELRSITLDGKELDVLVIFENGLEPYYLSSDYMGLHANFIYSRNGDTNTPKDKSADYNIIEKIWRQRFGLDVIPSERFFSILDDCEAWNISIGNREMAYYSPIPEYQIQFLEAKAGREIYSYYYPNENSFFGRAVFKYLSTSLFELEYAFLDEFRIPIAVPKRDFFEEYESYYFYFIQNSLEYKLFKLLGLKAYLMYLRPEHQPFIIFRNEEEHLEFNLHLRNIPNIQSLIEKENISIIRNRIENDGYGFWHSASFISFVVKEYERWKSQSNPTTAST